MKKIQLAGLVAANVLLIALLIFLPNTLQTTRAQRTAPTPAPPPTAGPPPPIEHSWPVLDQPLTQDQAVLRALEFDKVFAIWQEPWSRETFQNQPDRISIKWHSDRSYDGNEYGPLAEMGPVWVITIKGAVKFTDEGPERPYHDGLTYTIGQNSGSILGNTAGPFLK